MARIRTIKPEFPQSESMGRVSREARLCFILLFTLADDAGRLRGNSRMLASLLYPYDDDAKVHIDGWLNDLHLNGCIQRYEADGDQYIEICKWLIHQKIDKPSPSKIPAPTEESRTFAKPREDSSADQGKDQGKDQDQGREKPRKRVSPSVQPLATIDDLMQAGFPSNVAGDFIAHKASMKAPLTERAWRDHLVESQKAGWTPLEAAEKVMAKNWKGFEAKYVLNESPRKPAVPTYAQQDEMARRRRWEEMTGRKWPEDGQADFIDVDVLQIGGKA